MIEKGGEILPGVDITPLGVWYPPPFPPFKIGQGGGYPPPLILFLKNA